MSARHQTKRDLPTQVEADTATPWIERLPPRLTPSPPPTTDPVAQDFNHKPPPPLRASIYPHPNTSTWHVSVIPYSPAWPSQFTQIANHLHTVFTSADPPAPYLSLQHIGSTAVPGLAAKPNIDILVTFPSPQALTNAIEALNWELPTSPPFARYTQIPNGGGIPGRESFKLYLPTDHPFYATTPERSVYLIADVPENKAGRVQIRCYTTLRDVLREDQNRDLLEEYAKFKLDLSQRAFKDGIEYSALKDGMIRKILRRGGWTEEEVTEKEELTRREWVVDVEAAY